MPRLSDFDSKDIQIVSRPKLSTKKLPEPEVPVSDEDSLSLGDVAAMVGQGATLKFGDELLGALQAAKDVAFTDKELSDLSDLYRQYQKENEAKYEALAEAHPTASLVGELAGGFLIPGGLIAKGAKGAITGAKEASALVKALRAAKEGGTMGAKIGALAGIGSSKSDVSDMEALLKDAASGAAGGALLGGGLSAAGSGISSAASAIPKKLEKLGPLGENILASYRKGKEGLGFVSKEAEERISEQNVKSAKQLTEELMTPSEEVSSEISAHLKAGEEAGAKVDINENEPLQQGLARYIRNIHEDPISEIDRSIDKASLNRKIKAIRSKVTEGELTEEAAEAEIVKLNKNPPLKKKATTETAKVLKKQTKKDISKTPHELQDLLNDIQRLMQNEMTPQEAANLARRLAGEYVPGGQQIKRPDLIPAGLSDLIKEQAGKAADVALGTPGKTEELYGKFQDVRSLLPETILNKGVPTEYATTKVSGFDTPQEAKASLFSMIKDKIIPKLSDPVSTADDIRKTIDVLKTRITELNTKYPELNLNFDEVLNSLKSASQEDVIRGKLITKHGEHDTLTGLTKRILDAAGYGGSNVAGRVVGAGGRKIANFNNFIATASDATLMPVAKTLQSTKGVGFLGDALEGALNNKSVAAKNAAIFSIMQNPDARNALKDMVSSDEE